MPKISEDVIRAVTSAAKIEDVVSDFVELRKSGVNLTGLCPFHSDNHDGNFIVRPSTVSTFANTYHCFVCMRQGEGGGPVDFLMKAEHMTFPDAIRYLGKKYSIEVDNVPLGWTPPPPKPLPPPLPIMSIPKEWVVMTMRKATQTVFVQWLYTLPWSSEQWDRLPDTLWQYCVGCYPQRRDSQQPPTMWTTFWEIDADGVPRSAKLMKYQPDGHRMKGRFDTSYIYAMPKPKQMLNADGYRKAHPLFGSHLLSRYPNAEVHIVESEKTAIVMSNFYGESDKRLWLACGGVGKLTQNTESMQPLIDQGRTVWLWPDKDGAPQWQEVIDKLGSDHVKIYTSFLDVYWLPEDGPKADAADITIRMMHNPDWRPQAAPEESRTGTGQGGAAAASTDDERQLALCKDWAAAHPDEPFLESDEMTNSELHQWRQTIRDRYNYTPKK